MTIDVCSWICNHRQDSHLLVIKIAFSHSTFKCRVLSFFHEFIFGMLPKAPILLTFTLWEVNLRTSCIFDSIDVFFDSKFSISFLLHAPEYLLAHILQQNFFFMLFDWKLSGWFLLLSEQLLTFHRHHTFILKAIYAIWIVINLLNALGKNHHFVLRKNLFVITHHTVAIIHNMSIYDSPWQLLLRRHIQYFWAVDLSIENAIVICWYFQTFTLWIWLICIDSGLIDNVVGIFLFKIGQVNIWKAHAEIGFRALMIIKYTFALRNILNLTVTHFYFNFSYQIKN